MRYLALILLVILVGCADKTETKIEEKTDNNQQTEVKNEDTIIEETTEIDTVESIKAEPQESNEEISEEVEEEVATPTEPTLSEAELWARYKEAKIKLDEAKEKDNWEVMKAQLLIAGQSAEQLERPDIAAWQYNNIGYYAIEEFKEVTDYFTVLGKLDQLDYGKEKQEAYNKMVEIFSKNFYILEDANKYLSKAKEIDSELDDEIRTSRIENNLAFINEIQDLVKKDEN